MESDNWEQLTDTVRAAVSADHRFGADALLLARFAAPTGGERICELGCGCGVISLLLAAGSPAPASVLGVDIQPEAVRLARRGAEVFPGVPPEFAEGDWNVPGQIASAGCFDRVVCNPPYFAPGSGGISHSQAARIARHEQPGTLDAVCAAAGWLLRTGGRFCLCHRPEHLPRVMAALQKAGLEPKRLRPVTARADGAPWLFLVEAVKGARPGLVWSEPYTK